MATKTTARPPRIDRITGYGFVALWTRGPWWVIKTTATRPGIPTVPVVSLVHRRDVRAELDRHSDACMRLMLAESAWERRAA